MIAAAMINSVRVLIGWLARRFQCLAQEAYVVPYAMFRGPCEIAYRFCRHVPR